MNAVVVVVCSCWPKEGDSVNVVVVVVCSCWPKEGDSVNVVVVVCFCWPKEGDSLNTVVVAACSCWPKEDLGGGQRVSAVVAAVCSCWPEEEEVTVKVLWWLLSVLVGQRKKRPQCEFCGGCLFLLAKGTSHSVSAVVVAVYSCWPKEEEVTL